MRKKFRSLADIVFSILKFSPARNCIAQRKIVTVFIFTFLHSFISTFAQDTSHIRIALLTCTPGEELYSTFGHTAIRVTDSNSVADYVFNYGTFNFEDPGFYTKFVRGKLLYYISAAKFKDFQEEYQAENRGITEQVLNMNAAEKIALMEALYENWKPENRFYKYDFFLDNCTTRARDIIVRYKKDHPDFKPVMQPGTTFRQAIHQYLDNNNKYWSKLGIDLLLGVPTDAVMTTSQSQFLPDNLMKSLDNKGQKTRMALSTNSLYPIVKEDNSGFAFTPMIVFSLLLIMTVLLSISANKRAKIVLQGFEGILFFLTGVLGILLIFMWIGTDHSMTKGNYNLLWAWPTNAIMAFFVNSKKKWVAKYFGFSMATLIIVLLSWFFVPQQLNNALIPIVLMLAFLSAKKFLRSSS